MTLFDKLQRWLRVLSPLITPGLSSLKSTEIAVDECYFICFDIMEEGSEPRFKWFKVGPW